MFAKQIEAARRALGPLGCGIGGQSSEREAIRAVLISSSWGEGAGENRAEEIMGKACGAGGSGAF